MMSARVSMRHVTAPGCSEVVPVLLVPELRRCGIRAEAEEEELMAREKAFWKGQAGLENNHTGASYQ